MGSGNAALQTFPSLLMHLSDNELVLVILFEKIVVQKNNLSFEPINVNETHTQTHSLPITLALSLSHSLSLSSLFFLPFSLSQTFFIFLYHSLFFSFSLRLVSTKGWFSILNMSLNVDETLVVHSFNAKH